MTGSTSTTGSRPFTEFAPGAASFRFKRTVAARAP